MLGKKVNKRKHAVDRLLTDNLRLPWRWDQIKIKPNEVATAETFNLSMERLYYNLSYLISNTKLSPPTDVNFHEKLKLGDPVELQNTGMLPDAYAHGDIIHTITGTGSTGVTYSVAACGLSGNEIRLWSDHYSITDIVSGTGALTSNAIDNNESKTFRDLKALAKDNTDFIYVLDGATSTRGGTVYRYNINGILDGDPVMMGYENTTGRKLHKYIGGGPPSKIAVNDKHRFNDPKHMICDGETIYVIDTDIVKDIDTDEEHEVAVMKAYDTRLNWLYTKPVVNNIEFKDIIIYNNNFLVLTGNVINEYDHSFKFLRTIELEKSDDIGSPLFIISSHVNPNILYIIRDTTIEKLYYTRLPDIIRRYSIYNIKFSFVSVYTKMISLRGDINILDLDNDADTITIRPSELVDGSSNFPSYYWLENEDIIRKKILFDTFSEQIFSFDEIKIHPEEYINSFVYNKTIGKMLYNLQLFIDNIKGVFAIKADNLASDGKTVEEKFIGVHYAIDQPLFKDGYDATIDNFVHINEPFITSVFNRCLYELYNIQLGLLDIISLQRIYDSNIFELADILADLCPGGIKTDNDRSTLTDDDKCIMPDDDNENINVCPLPIVAETFGELIDDEGCCIVYKP